MLNSPLLQALAAEQRSAVEALIEAHGGDIAVTAAAASVTAQQLHDLLDGHPASKPVLENIVEHCHFTRRDPRLAQRLDEALTGYAKAAARADSAAPPAPGPDWAKIAQSTVGTADSEAAIADRHDVNVDDVVERLLDFNVETCPGCGWWVESHELADNDTCDGCRN